MRRTTLLRLALGATVTSSACTAALAAPASRPATTAPADPTHRLPDFDKLWDYDHPDATERKFRALLPAAESAGDRSYLLQLTTQIARCQGLQRQFDACHATLDDVERQLADGPPVARVRYLLERGRAFNSADHADRAKPLFAEAWDRACAAQLTTYAIDAAHMIAIVEPEPDRRVAWNLKALELARPDPAQQGWLPAIYNNLGEAYRAGRQYERALDCFERRADWFKRRGRSPDVYNVKDIARMNRLLGHTDVALRTIEPVARDLQAKGKVDGYVSAEYGQCLAAAGRPAEARPFLIDAYRILSKDEYMVHEEPEELRRIKELAGIKD